MTRMEKPQYNWEALRAAVDPLTPDSVLWAIYSDSFRLDAQLFNKLAVNPSLPAEIFEDMLATISYDVAAASHMARNPLLSFEDLKELVILTTKIDLKLLGTFSSALEIFDFLIEKENYDPSNFFIPALLRHPSVSEEEYMKRIIAHYHLFDDPSLLEDYRFDTNMLVAPYDRSVIQAIIKNPNSSPELLLDITVTTASGAILSTKVLENLNYPIELSALHHFEK